MSMQTLDAPALTVRLETPAGAVTRMCRFAGNTFTVAQAGSWSNVPAEDVVDVLTQEITQAAPEDAVTIAAVMTVDEQVFVHALAERREGGWTDLRHALEPVVTTWDDVRAGVVTAMMTLMTAAAGNAHEPARSR